MLKWLLKKNTDNRDACKNTAGKASRPLPKWPARNKRTPMTRLTNDQNHIRGRRGQTPAGRVANGVGIYYLKYQQQNAAQHWLKIPCKKTGDVLIHS